MKEEKVNGSKSPKKEKEDDVSTAPVSASGSQDSGRIVLTIKQGKVYNGSLEDIREGSSHNGKQHRLVPYQDESSDEENINSNNNKTESDKYNKKASHKAGLSASDSEPVLDKRLNATVNVPGAYRPLDQGPDPLSFKKDETQYCKDGKHRYGGATLKRSLSEGNSPLTVATCLPDATKVKSTTSWHVLDQENQVSPSIASSTGSVNSTTDWQVSAGNDNKTPLVPEAQFVGWKVTSKNEGKKENTNGTCDKDAKEAHNDLTITIKKSVSSGSTSSSGEADSYVAVSASDKNSKLSRSESITSSKDESKSTSISTLSPLSSLSPECKADSEADTSQTHLLNGHQESDKDINVHKKHKKNKKHKRHKDSSDKDSAEYNDSDHTLKHKKKKKHKKHKHEDEHALLNSDEESPNGHKRHSCNETDGTKKKRELTSSEEEYEWVERTKESIDRARNKIGKKEGELSLGKYRDDNLQLHGFSESLTKREILHLVAHRHYFQ